nr:vWA domain-containing protein [Thermoanaerobaculia bacterium]
DTATVLFPLTELSSPEVRSAASDAVGKVDDSGKTSLTAGLSAGLAELEKARDPGRAQHLIFLTDGAGAYDPDLAVQAARAGIKIHTVGLGSEVNADLLGNIAHVTGGNYYPVAKASQLVATFNRILERATDMRQARGGHGAPEAEALTNPWLHYTLRVLAWALMGLLLGLGQGLRYNTREDFRACGLGGLLGGALGGALFDPISSWLAFSTGVIGRGVADTVVGASIGGSLRLLQEKLVEEAGKPTHQLVAFLPPSDRRLVFVPTGRTEAAVVVGTSKNRPELQPAPAPGPVAGPAAPPPPVKVPGHSPVPPSIESYSQRYPDRQEAMARAYLEGGLRLSEIAQFFNVPLATVRRAVDRRKGEPST